jgi:CRP-like cAMP-binding protein
MLTKYFEQFPLLTYKRKEIIYRQGEMIEQVAFVKEGFVRLYSTSAEGREATVSFFKPVFPVTLIYSGKKSESAFNLQAITDVRLWKSPRAAFDKFLLENPKVNLEINNTLCDICLELINNINNVISGSASSKIIGIIRALAKETGTKEDNFTKINIETTHAMLASMTGLTRETVTIQLNKLEKEGLIKTKESFIELTEG